MPLHTVSAAADSSCFCLATKQPLAFSDLLERKRAYGAYGTVSVHSSRMDAKWTSVTLTDATPAGVRTRVFTLRT